MRLREVHQRFIVTRLACFATPTEVTEEFEEEFGHAITRGQAGYYNPTTPNSKMSGKWKDLFEETRARYIAEAAEVGVAHQRYRLEQLQKLYTKALRAGRSGNVKLAMEILEQAAKEEGGAFTNRSKVEHDGQIKTSGVLLVPAGGDPKDWTIAAAEQQRSLGGSSRDASDKAKGDMGS